MPVTKSAKKALRTATRRHSENVLHKNAFKKALKDARKAVETGGENVAALFSEVQSTLDRAAKKHTIHPNKAARLKSRLSKKMTTESTTPTVTKKASSSKAKPKAKTTAKSSKKKA